MEESFGEMVVRIRAEGGEVEFRRDFDNPSGQLWVYVAIPIKGSSLADWAVVSVPESQEWSEAKEEAARVSAVKVAYRACKSRALLRAGPPPPPETLENDDAKMLLSLGVVW